MSTAEPVTLDRRYELIESLGEGGGGSVYLARDTLQDGRLVALKTLRAHSGEELDTFAEEFSLLAGLEHPCLVANYDLGMAEGVDERTPTRYFTMEYVPGGTLHDLPQPLPLEDAYAIVSSLLEALAHLHDSGCVHFDVKPSNVLLSGAPLGEEGAVKLADFGLAGRAGRGREFRGTPAFAPPELVAREHADGRADLYGLGALLYWMLCGRPPFVAGDSTEILRMHLEEAPEPPSRHRAELPEEVERFTLRLLAKNPASRFDSARSAAAAFTQAAGIEPPVWTSPRRAPFVGRRRELRLLGHALDGLAAKSGPRTGLHVVTGEAGIGKTRLVDEFRVLCQTRDVAFLSASVSAVGRAPLAGAQTLLAQLGALEDGAADTVEGEVIAADIVDRVVRAASRSRRPFVIFFDDAEGADAPTVDVLRELAKVAAEAYMPFVLVAAAGDEVAENRRLEETLYLLRSEDVAEDLPLAPLEEDEVAELARSFLGRHDGVPELARRLVREVGGLPLAITTALEFLTSSGVGGELVTPRRLDLAAMPLPQSLRDAVAHRLDALDASALEILKLLAVLRTPVPLDELCALAAAASGEDALDREGVAIALAAAAEAQLARSAGSAKHPRWTVASGAARQTLLRRMEQGERSRLHRVVSEHLAAAGAPVEEVAFHAVASIGDDVEAVDPAFRAQAAHTAAAAGRRFLELEDHARARELLEAAVRLELDADKRSHVALDLATTLQRIGDNQALRAALEHVDERHLEGALLGKMHLMRGQAEMGDRRIDPAREAFTAATRTAAGEDLVTAHGNLGLLSMRAGDLEGFRVQVDRARELAELAGEPELEAQAQTLRGHYHRVRGKMAEAREDYARAAEVLAPRGPSALLRQAYHHLAWISGYLEDDEQATEYYRRSNAVATATGIIGDLSRSHRGLGYQHLSAGEVDEAERHLRISLEISDRFGGTERGYIFLGFVHVHLMRCDYRECRRALDEATREAKADQHAGLLAELDVFRAMLALALGESEAVELAQKADAFYERVGGHVSWESKLVLGQALEQQGDAQGLTLMRQALSLAEEAGRRKGVLLCLAGLVEGLDREGDQGAERRALALRLLAMARQTRHAPDLIQAALRAGSTFARDRRPQGVLTLEGGEGVSLQGVIEQALAVAREGPQPEAVWRLEADLARLLLADGRLEDAGAHIRLAYTTLEEIWRKLPSGARDSYLQLPDQRAVRELIRAYNEAVAAATAAGAESSAPAPATFLLDEPAPAPRAADDGLARAPSEAFQSKLPRRRLAAFYEVSRRISAVKGRDPLLAEVLNLAIKELDADRGIVFLMGEDGELAPAVRRDLEPGAMREAGEYSRRLVAEVAGGSASVLLADAQASAAASAETAMRYGITSILCVPMRTPSRLIGTLYVDSRKASRRFSEGDREFLSAFGDIAAVAIENATQVAQKDEEIEELKKRVSRQDELDRVIGSSQVLRDTLSLARRAAESDAPVLITGETGTGKELLARAIHGASRRADRPLVVVDCTTLPDALAESELFGHVAGAFTDARDAREGLLVQADGGTVLIDEIGDLPLPLQGALLRFLQEGELRPVGGSTYVRVDVRVLCATHRDLESMIADGSFRQDLFYRINVLSLRLAPLRERREDIPLLVDHFLARLALQEGRRLTVTPACMRLLQSHDWPGNVRELSNSLRGAAVLARGGVIDEEAFQALAPVAPDELSEPEDRRRSVEQALTATGGHVARAAERLGVSVRTLYRRMDELGLKAGDFRV